ncbi:MAG: hypothetical protein AB7D28_03750 [Candidatus Berkiella sp.]
MFEPQRLLSRLNPISVDWKNNIAITGEVLRAEDIAAALSGLEKGPYLLIRYLWAGDQSVITELYALILRETKILADNQNWQCKKNTTRLFSLVKMAFYEMQNTSLCKPCHGSGAHLNETCLSCNGVGTKRRKYSEYARCCGVKAANWKKCWEHKYYQVQLILQEWEKIGIDHLLEKLC